MPVFKQLYFASLATHIAQGEKHKDEWTEDGNPSTANKCNPLGRSTTGNEFPQYSTPSPQIVLALPNKKERVNNADQPGIMLD